MGSPVDVMIATTLFDDTRAPDAGSVLMTWPSGTDSDAAPKRAKQSSVDGDVVRLSRIYSTIFEGHRQTHTWTNIQARNQRVTTRHTNSEFSYPRRSARRDPNLAEWSVAAEFSFELSDRVVDS